MLVTYNQPLTIPFNYGANQLFDVDDIEKKQVFTGTVNPEVLYSVFKLNTFWPIFFRHGLPLPYPRAERQCLAQSHLVGFMPKDKILIHYLPISSPVILTTTSNCLSVIHISSDFHLLCFNSLPLCFIVLRSVIIRGAAQIYEGERAFKKDCINPQGSFYSTDQPVLDFFCQQKRLETLLVHSRNICIYQVPTSN